MTNKNLCYKKYFIKRNDYKGDDKMFDFLKEEDIIKLAKAVIKKPLTYIIGEHIPYFFCEHCDAEMINIDVEKKGFQHKPGCPVVIALDILTNQL